MPANQSREYRFGRRWAHSQWTSTPPLLPHGWEFRCGWCTFSFFLHRQLHVAHPSPSHQCGTPYIPTCFTFSILLLILFWSSERHLERKGGTPLMPVSLWSRPKFALVQLVGGLGWAFSLRSFNFYIHLCTSSPANPPSHHAQIQFFAALLSVSPTPLLPIPCSLIPTHLSRL